MQINEISWRNFNSYGNITQRIDFQNDQGDLYLLLGKNGHGKCLSPDTIIEVEIEDPEIQSKFLRFLREKSLYNLPPIASKIKSKLIE
jgi:ABC-type Mn2+/Zn2+ transport system ATPase subunit